MRCFATTGNEPWKPFGFTFHTLYGVPLPVSRRGRIPFALAQMENDIEGPTIELMLLCFQIVEQVGHDGEVLSSICLVEFYPQGLAPWIQDIRVFMPVLALPITIAVQPGFLELNADRSF